MTYAIALTALADPTRRSVFERLIAAHPELAYRSDHVYAPVQGNRPLYALFECCIDLDRSAMNTIGNAVETRRWARARGFHSLLVVTSAYHMPRAIAELEHELPDVTLIEFPVWTERQRQNPWWTDGATARLVISEYLKYVYTVMRIHVVPREPALVARGARTAG